MSAHDPSAPADEWDFLDEDQRDDTADDDLSPEEAALHEDDPDARGLRDPARREVDLDTDDPHDEAHWPDEDDGRPAADDGEVHDLEEMLEAQHYAFPPDEEE